MVKLSRVTFIVNCARLLTVTNEPVSGRPPMSDEETPVIVYGNVASGVFGVVCKNIVNELDSTTDLSVVVRVNLRAANLNMNMEDNYKMIFTTKWLSSLSGAQLMLDQSDSPVDYFHYPPSCVSTNNQYPSFTCSYLKHVPDHL